MDTETFSWGVGSLSKLMLEPDGECDTLTYVNELSISPGLANDYTHVLGGHTVTINFGPQEVPDVFSVVPAYGWEVIGDNLISVAEGAIATIKVCQILLG